MDFPLSQLISVQLVELIPGPIHPLFVQGLQPIQLPRPHPLIDPPPRPHSQRNVSIA